MKKFIVSAFLVFTLLISTSCLETASQKTADARELAEQAQGEAAAVAAESLPIPTVSYFQERRTIIKWTERWDKPGVVSYVYVISYGTIIGYYVVDGKPASTRSYLMPEETKIRADLGEYPGEMLVSAPDIDGTYGDNNPGIRFFTAEGAAVEVGGNLGYIFSDTLLALDVPRLIKAKP